MNSETKIAKAEIRLKVKDIQLSKLQEQLHLRDDLLNIARRAMNDNQNTQNLSDNRIMTIEQILYDSKHLFEPLNSGKNNGGEQSARKPYASQN